MIKLWILKRQYILAKTTDILRLMLAMLLQLAFVTNAGAEVYPASFDKSQFICTILQAVADGKIDWNQRQRKIDAFRERYHDGLWPWEKINLDSQELSSLPIIDFDRWYPRYGGSIECRAYERLTIDANFGSLVDRDDLPQLLAEKIVLVRDKMGERQGTLKNKMMIKAKTRHDFQSQLFGNESSNFNEIHMYVEEAKEIAQPVILWLFHQKKNSIEVNVLLSETIRIYDGDVFTALGILGFLFNSERISAYPRDLKAVLATRMTKLLFSDRLQDLVGANYHFWSYFNIGLTTRYSSIASAFSYFYEYVKSHDIDDYSADNLGLILGSSTRISLNQNQPCN